MNRTSHSLVAFLALIAAIVALGMTSAVVSYLGCGERGETTAIAAAVSALTALAGVFRPSSATIPQQQEPSDGPPSLSP